MNLDGSQLAKLLPYQEDWVGESSWSSGHRIAFAGWTQIPPVEENDIYTIRPDGSDLTNVTRQPHRAASRYALAPSRERISGTRRRHRDEYLAASSLAWDGHA